MKKSWINLIFTIFSLLTILIFALLRSEVDKLSFVVAFDKVVAIIIFSIWNLITIPTVFVSLLIALLLWKYQSEIMAIIPNLKEIKAGSISATFEDTQNNKNLDGLPNVESESATSLGVINPYAVTSEKKNLEMLALFCGSKTIEYLLGLNGKLLTVAESVDIYRKHLETEINPFVEEHYSEREKFVYYYGMYMAFIKHKGRFFISSKTTEDKVAAYFFLAPHSQEILTARLKAIEKIRRENEEKIKRGNVDDKKK